MRYTVQQNANPIKPSSQFVVMDTFDDSLYDSHATQEAAQSHADELNANTSEVPDRACCTCCGC